MTSKQANREADKLWNKIPTSRAAIKQEQQEALKTLENEQMVIGLIRLLRAFFIMQAGLGNFCDSFKVAACRIAYQHFLRKPSTKRKKTK